MSCCKGTGKIKSIVAVKSGWNYPNKFAKALEENNTKYIDMLFKKGIVFTIK
jgi:hypothetical protein